MTGARSSCTRPVAWVTSIGSTPGPTRSRRTRYGPIGIDLHGLLVTANEKTAYITARGVADEIKVLNLDGTDVSTILIDPRPGVADRPDSLARKGSNLYVTVRFSGQVARIKTQTGSVEYIDVAPPATSGYAVHGIAVRP